MPRRRQTELIRYLKQNLKFPTPKTIRHANEESGYIEFKNVTFSYHGAEEPAISNISFSAKPGETTAIIGGTGSGKSTIVNLIPRFYDTDSGEVLVDGVNVKEMSQQELRAKIGFVPQKAILFSGTISENLRYGKDDATDEEIIHAAEVAQAADFIVEMKDSYDTLLSEGGLNLSGGQKQRLSIARSLVRKPEIYVFDDSFSALDFKTDAKLRPRLKRKPQILPLLLLLKGSALSWTQTVSSCLRKERYAGIGTHKELMSNCEIYREIVSSQLSEEELA